MLVELLSGRLIAPSFGSSIYVWGSVIFVFMLGLAIGYLLGGIYSRYNARASAAVRHSVRLGAHHASDRCCSATRFSISCSADVTTRALARCSPVSGFSGADHFRRHGVALCHPHHREEPGILGHDAGYLYFVSTIGSSLGTLLTAFYLVLLFEVNTILMVAIGDFDRAGQYWCTRELRKV